MICTGYSYSDACDACAACAGDRRVHGYHDALLAVRDRKRALQSMACW